MTDYKLPELPEQAETTWAKTPDENGTFRASGLYTAMLAAAPAIDYDAMAVELLSTWLKVGSMSAALRATFGDSK